MEENGSVPSIKRKSLHTFAWNVVVWCRMWLFSLEKSHSKLHIKLNISCRLSLWVQTAVEKNAVSQERKVQACLRVQRYWRGFRSALHSDRVTKGSDSDLVRSGHTKVWFVNLREAAMGIPVHNHVKVLVWRKYQKSPRFSEIGFSALS